MYLMNTNVLLQICSVATLKKLTHGIMLVLNHFHSLIKREWLNRFKIRDYGHAYRLVFEYLEAFYNTKRIHSHCDYMSPNDYEDLYRRVQQHKLLMVG